MFRSIRSTVVLTTLGLGTLAQAQATAPAQPAQVPPRQAPMSVPTAAAPAPAAAMKEAAATKDAAGLAYRNATTAPLQGWTGPVFQLSHDYPQKDPGACPPNVCTWLTTKPGTFDETPGDKQAQWTPEWAQYMKKLLDYAREGQDLQLDNKVGWQVKVNGNTRWFHIPWMAYDTKTGREFVHGLTNERTASISDFLGKDQVVEEGLNKLALSATKETAQGFETWAFGVYNEWGGYAIGRSWNPDGTPRIDTNHNGGPQPAGLPFPEGTMVTKLLFTTATPKDVPYLEGSPVWQAYRHQTKGTQFLCERQVQEVRLIQMDVAVVDKHSPTRWVFGTFAYNGKLKGASVWDRLAPVGVQWGNDPWATPASAKADSLPVVQSVLNTNTGTYQHFGCANRLAGPVDNKLSSCMACHANAYTPQAGVAGTMPTTLPPIFGFPGQCKTNSVDNANYFTNNQFPMSYTGGQYPNMMNMDTSLQMWVAFLQYGQFNQFKQPEACENPRGI